MLESVDGLGFIGADAGGADNVYVITGDSGNGLTHGAVAGLLLPQLIQTRKHPWTRVYAPNRTRFHALGTMAAEAAKSNAPYADWVRGGDVAGIDQIPRGSGATIRKGTHLLAVYRDDRGQCHVKNAKCTHLGAVVDDRQRQRTRRRLLGERGKGPVA